MSEISEQANELQSQLLNPKHPASTINDDTKYTVMAFLLIAKSIDRLADKVDQIADNMD